MLSKLVEGTCRVERPYLLEKIISTSYIRGGECTHYVKQFDSDYVVWSMLESKQIFSCPNLLLPLSKLMWESIKYHIHSPLRYSRNKRTRLT